jgi:hypothetical protein
LGVQKGVGLERHHSKHENCGDLHLELIKKWNVDMCSRGDFDCRDFEMVSKRVYELKRERKSSFLFSNFNESEF